MAKRKQQELSMLEAAESLIKRKIKPQKFAKISKEVFELMGISDSEELIAHTAQLYTDLSLSGKFVALGDDLWDLKSRQPFDVADYDTYDLDFETEEPVSLLGDDAPGVTVTEGKEDAEDQEPETTISTSDDYSDESNAQAKEDEHSEHEGLSVYKEEELN